MKLSEAIRIGASKTGKCRNYYFNKSGTRACAFGAALIGMGYTAKDLATHSIDELIGLNTTLAYVQHPVRKGDQFSLYTVITHLNDECKWSRPRIADWLESIGY